VHAAALDGDVVQRDPEVGGDEIRVERVDLVLVPGRGRAIVRGLVDRVIESVFDALLEQPLGERAAARERERGLERRLELQRPVDLEDLRQVLAAARQVVRPPL
jgi:hypothetical protein